MIFKPTFVFDSAADITPRFLEKENIKGLILDLDNTLTTHNNPTPPKRITEWIDIMKSSGVKLIIVSNNHDERVKPFAEILGLDYVPEGRKPLAKGFKQAQKRLEIPFKNIGIVGDQIFTDILGANFLGVKTIFTFPIEYESGFWFRVKRAIEKPLLPKRKRKGAE